MEKKKKFQSGSASVLDDPNILDVLPQIQKPNLQSDKIGDIRALLPLLAMGAYSSVSPMIDTPSGKVFAPSEEEIRKQQEEDAKRAKDTGIKPVPVINDPLITPLPEPKGLLDDASITTQQPRIDSSNVTPIPDPVTVDDLILTMDDKKKQSKALVPTKMMENIDDIKIEGNDIAPRFNKTQDYIKSNYSGTEKKELNAWVNELFADDKGLTLELRDSGGSAALNALNQTNDKKVYSASEILGLLQDKSFPNQLGSFDNNYKIMGKDQNLLPQIVESASNTVSQIIDPRPGPLSDAIERIKNMDLEFYQQLGRANTSEQAGDLLDQRITRLFDIIDESGIPRENFSSSKEFTLIEEEFRKANQAATGNVFTNEHISVGTPGTNAAEYVVMTHNFNPYFGQDATLVEHSGQHPNDKNTIAFSRSRLITNQAPDAKNANGIVIMEMQSDVHRNFALNKTDIEYPTSENLFKGGKNFYPFGGGAQYWIKQVLKDNIENAVKNNLDFVGWNPGEVVSVYENASDEDDRRGYNTIYNNKTNEFIKKINKDIAKRGKQLGLNKEQIESAQLVVRNDAQYIFPSLTREGYGEPSSMRYTQELENIPNLKNYVRVGENRALNLVNMPYIDLRAEGFDLNLFKKIGLPQFKKGGKTNEDMGNPLIDIEIFLKSV